MGEGRGVCARCFVSTGGRMTEGRVGEQWWPATMATGDENAGVLTVGPDGASPAATNLPHHPGRAFYRAV